MKKISAVLALSVAFAAGAVVSAQVHDWHDLDRVHDHVVEAIHEMEHARAATTMTWQDTAPRPRSTCMRPNTS